MTRVRFTRGMRLAALLAAIGVLATAGQAVAQDKNPHSSQGCAACHTPHNADADTSVPLWATSVLDDGVEESRVTTNEGIDLTSYTSDSMDAVDAGNAVTGASLLCLSCHDGTHGGPSRAFGVGNGQGALSHAHPMGIEYTEALVAADGELQPVADVKAKGALDNAGKVGCTSCHDVHVQRETASSAGENYLRWAYLDDYDHVAHTGDRRSDDFCNNCHIK